MASGQSKKTTSAGRSGGTGKTTSRKKTQTRATNKTTGKKTSSASRRTQQEVYSDGIMLACVIALMLFIICCNAGFCGPVGKVVSSILFGLFGVIQYVLPFAICGAFVMAVVYNYSGVILRKITLSAVFTLFLCALGHMVVHISWGFDKLGASYLYSSQHKTGGGFFGALITSVFYPLLAASGTWLLVILVLIILFLLIAGTSVLDLAKRISSWYAVDEEEMLAREELRAKRQETAMARQKARKDVRRQRYESAAMREEQQLSELEQRRLARKREIAEGGLSIMDSQAPIRLKPGEKDMGLLPAEEKNTAILSDAGLLSTKEKEADVTRPSSGEEKKKGQSVKQESPLTVGPEGELRITGLFEKESEEETGLDGAKKRGGSRQRSRTRETKQETMPVSSFASTMETAKVMETTAEFVAEEDLPQVKETGTSYSDPVKAEKESVKPVSHRRTKETARETAQETAKTAQAIAAHATEEHQNYERPLVELLSRGSRAKGSSKAELQATARKLEETLESFGVHVTVTDVSCGPAVTRYEMLPEQGTRVSKITGLADDIKLNLAVADIRIEAPIPGKAAIGIEVPNKEASAVAFRDLLEESDFLKQPSDLSFAVGKDIGGKVVISDIGKMPHVLIAGATGSGKSVCINTLIMSLLYKTHPDDVKLIMIDPKVVELSVYNGIPHLLIPVVTDPKKASGALNWAVAEMEARYKKFAEYNVRNLEGYNKKVDSLTARGENPEGEIKRMPKIVIIVDELADLMMVAHGEVEDAIVRLSQLARAAGIHLVIATQRPSVDVITGLIKANVPSRIAFAVSSGVDSRTILDMNGAEKLLGKGDMLFAPSGYPKPIRVQGAFVSDKEVSKVVEFLKAQDLKVQYNDNITREINCGPQSVRDANREQERDEYFVDAGKFIIEKEKASIGMLQRVYKIGFNRAARIMDQLSEAGVVGPEEGTKPRQILMSMEEFENFLEQGL